MCGKMHHFFLLFSIHVASTAGENPLLIAMRNSDQIAQTAECVLKLSAKYFVEKKALSGSIVIININSYRSTTQRLLLQTIHGGMKYSVMVKDSSYPHANASHFPEKAKNYMLILEIKSELRRNVLQLNKLPTWNPLAKAVVFYQLKDDEIEEQIAKEFINELRDFKLFKTIVLIYKEDEDKVVAYTWRPYSDNNCGGKCESVYILDKCFNNRIYEIQTQIEMFPQNMKKCPLVTYAVVSDPYVMPPVRKIANTDYDDVYEFDRGAEINLVKIICQYTNMTLVVRTADGEENWGTIYPDGTATGAYNILRNDTVDLVIGNIEVTGTIRKWFHPTVSYTQDDMTWCIPKARQAPTWDNLVIIFQWQTWLATLMILIVMGVLFHYFYYKEHNNTTKWPTNSILMAFAMLLGWGVKFNPKSMTFRILIFGWLCFSINMSISYESFLRIFLMHPRFEKQITTEAEIIQAGIPIGGREIYQTYFQSNNASSFYLYRKYEPTTFIEGITRVALDRNFAVVSSRRQAEFQDQKLGRGAPLIYCFPEENNLYKYGVVLLARKWFPLLDRFNMIIRSVSENGLIDKWNKELFIHTVSEDGMNSIVPLSVQHLMGAFMFIGFMYLISVLVFLYELLSGYFRNKMSGLNTYRRRYIP